MWCPLQASTPHWIYIGIQISKEQRPGKTVKAVEDEVLDGDHNGSAMQGGPKLSAAAMMYIFTSEDV